MTTEQNAASTADGPTNGGTSKSSVISKRYDFVLLFDVQDGNPNGDPDAGNVPRMDPETRHGLVTDVCIKRKVRDYVLIKHGGTRPFDIYVQEGAVLNNLHREAYEAKEVEVTEEVERQVPEDLRPVFTDDFEVPEGFEVRSVEDEATQGEGEAAAPEQPAEARAADVATSTYAAGENASPPEQAAEAPEQGDDRGPLWLVYSGDLSKEDLSEAIKQMGAQVRNAAMKKRLGTFLRSVAKGAKRKPTRDEIGDVRGEMCDRFFDVRTFGAVMSTGVNAGQVRGPVQLTFARSVDPIVALEHCVTRVAITKPEDAERKKTEMGRKNTVPYGLYRAHGFVSPALAERAAGRQAQGTGFTEADLTLLWEALEHMFEHDRSAARGLMSTRALVIFEHESKLGSAKAHDLFERVVVKCAKTPPRSFADYEVKLDGEPLASVRKLVPAARNGGGAGPGQPASA